MNTNRKSDLTPLHDINVVEEAKRRVTRALADHERRHRAADPVARFCAEQTKNEKIRAHVLLQTPGGGRRGTWIDVPRREKPVTGVQKTVAAALKADAALKELARTRAELWDAWARWWGEAQARGLEVEPVAYDASNEVILRRGRALRRLVLEARERTETP